MLCVFRTRVVGYSRSALQFFRTNSLLASKSLLHKINKKALANSNNAKGQPQIDRVGHYVEGMCKKKKGREIPNTILTIKEIVFLLASTQKSDAATKVDNVGLDCL